MPTNPGAAAWLGTFAALSEGIPRALGVPACHLSPVTHTGPAKPAEETSPLLGLPEWTFPGRSV